MFAHGVLKIIYAPQKAFKEIMQAPKLIGPLIIMIMFILASIGNEYARASKVYVQQMQPSSLDANNPDPWTEDSKMWRSNANVTTDNTDRLLGTGSIQFNATNDVTMWMSLDNISAINCLDPSGYDNLTFRLKWTNALSIAPQNASLNLFSKDATSYFSSDLLEFIIMAGNSYWSNITIPLGPNALGWSNNGTQPSWDNITGLRIDANWPETARSNLTIRMDRLFFQSERYEPLINSMGDSYTTSAFYAAISFAMNWMLFSLLFYVASRIFKIKADLKTLFILIGYSLIAFVFMQLVQGIFYLTVSPMYFSLDSVTPMSVFQNILLFSSYTALLLPIWSIVLAALGAKAGFNLPLHNCIVMAIIGFLPHYALMMLA